MEEHEVFTHFERERDNWLAKFYLEYPNEKPHLFVELIDTASSKLYATKMDEEHLARNAEMKMIFPTLEDLFYHLAHNFSSLQLGASSLEFSVALGEGAKKRRLPFAIFLNQKELSKEDNNEVKIKLL